MIGDKVILLGTKGGPRITTGSSWPSSSVVELSGRPYLVDCGMGVTRQFVEAGYDLGQINTILLTHLHSDHCLELGPLLHTIWVSSPERKIKVYGPPGTSNLVVKFYEAMSYDIDMRIADEKQKNPRGMANCMEFQEGLVFKDDLVYILQPVGLVPNAHGGNRRSTSRRRRYITRDWLRVVCVERGDISWRCVFFVERKHGSSIAIYHPHPVRIVSKRHKRT